MRGPGLGLVLSECMARPRLQVVFLRLGLWQAAVMYPAAELCSDHGRFARLGRARAPSALGELGLAVPPGIADRLFALVGSAHAEVTRPRGRQFPSMQRLMCAEVPAATEDHSFRPPDTVAHEGHVVIRWPKPAVRSRGRQLKRRLPPNDNWTMPTRVRPASEATGNPRQISIERERSAHSLVGMGRK